MSVKRFTPAIETHYKSGLQSPVMVENKTGAYYRLDDYQKLESELATLRAEHDQLQKRVAELELQFDECHARLCSHDNCVLNGVNCKGASQ